MIPFLPDDVANLNDFIDMIKGNILYLFYNNKKKVSN